MVFSLQDLRGVQRLLRMEIYVRIFIRTVMQVSNDFYFCMPFGTIH